MPTKKFTVSELKTKLGALMSELGRQGVPLYVTQYGRPKAVLKRYEDYESLLKKLEDLEDMLAMREALSAPEEEAITLDEYERPRASRVRG